MYTRNLGMMPRTVNGLMNDFFGGFNRTDDAALYQVPVNIAENEAAFEMQVVAPGLNKEDFKVNVDNNLLTVSFEHKDEMKEADKNHKILRAEYKMRSFKRSFSLNEKIDAAKISARYADGILFISLPKKEVVQPATQQIAVN